MNRLTMLRATAVVMAVVGTVDPSITQTQHLPAPIEIRHSTSALASNELRSAAGDVQERLKKALGREVAFNSDAAPAARVTIGGKPTARDEAADVPQSTIRLDDPSGPGVRILAVNDPAPVPVGWVTGITASIEARGLAGATSTFVLEERGAEIARVERAWSSHLERTTVTLPYSPTREGVSRVSLRVRPARSGTSVSDNDVDVAIAASGRRLRVLVHESRPSWSVAFLRRVLEENPTFDVSTVVRLSRRTAVRAGSPPIGLVPGSLDDYDAVIVGAPEDLSAADITALETFARVRGGAVVLVPDRRPAGRYAALVGAVEFDEVLVNDPVEARASSAVTLYASELVVPKQDPSGADVLASVETQRAVRPLIFSRSLGAGTVIFSGALDAWRYRGRADDGFSRFWQMTMAEAALRAPAKLAVEIEPPVALPGVEVRLSARIRRTEWQELPDRTVVPPIGARIIGPRGIEESIRLWPSAEAGLFEGTVKAPEAGSYDVQVRSAAVTADAVLVAAANARPSSALRAAEEAPALVAAATGGVVVNASDLGPLERHLRSLPKAERRVAAHPARTWWFALVFAGLLSAEWALRRKRGLQ